MGAIKPGYYTRMGAAIRATTLRKLEAAGLIELDKRDIRILDAQRLARYPAS